MQVTDLRFWRAVACVAIVVALGGTFASTHSAGESATAYRNGHWFDGNGFRQRAAVYVINGRLSWRRPEHVDSTVDLQGGYVVPPFGEAHNHNVAPASDVPKLVHTYLEHGIFYVKNPNNLPRDRATVGPLVNRPDSIDVTFANGGWTSTGGHPIEIVKRQQDSKRWTQTDGDGGFLWIADSPADVDRKWPQYIAQNPQFTKVYLLYSDDARRQDEDQARYFAWKGLTPDTLRVIVEHAHAAHLRVSAHIEDARDFHEAVLAGVDEINHMPGFRMFADVDSHKADEFQISDDDAELAHRKRTVVVTTLMDAAALTGDKHAQQDSLNIRNLEMLLRHHVAIALGSDSYRQDTLPEALYLASLHAMSNASLLRMWTESTAATIFPERKVGKLQEGYEASFLVLSGNPLSDFANVTHITRRVKQGQPLP